MTTLQAKLPLSENATAAVITAMLLGVSVLLHLSWCGTPMQSSEQSWQEIVRYHQEFYPFSVRVLTTYPVLWIHQLSGLPVRETFFIFQYLLAAILGLIFYRFLRLLGFERRWSQAGLLLMLTSFPILFAHSEPVFTWDDLWVYLALTLSFGTLLRGRWIAAALWFTLGLFAREQMALYYPAFVFGLWLGRDTERRGTMIAAALVPLILFVPYWFAVWREPDPMRFRLLAFNFQDWPHSINSLFSLFISFGFLWVPWMLGLMSSPPRAADNESLHRFLSVGSVLMVLPTVVVGLVFAYARETRIFFPPFVLLLPLALVALRTQLASLAQVRRSRRVFALVVALLAGGVVGALLFQGFEYRNCPEFCRNWGSLQMGLSFGVAAMALLTRGATVAQDSESGRHSDVG